MPNRAQFLRTLVAGFAVSFALSCVSTASAQSGRRVRKPPAPAATPEPEPTLKASSEKPKPALTLIVGMDRYSNFAGIPLYVYDGVLRSFSDRLDDSDSVKVEPAQRDMSRGDATNRAKAEKEAYVVWLQLRSDTMGDDNNRNLNNITIEYWVFAPATAKIATSGRTYPQATRNKSVILNPKNGSIYGDYLLNQAAREAAERILAALRTHAPPPAKLPWSGFERRIFRIRIEVVDHVAILLINHPSFHL